MVCGRVTTLQLISHEGLQSVFSKVILSSVADVPTVPAQANIAIGGNSGALDEDVDIEAGGVLGTVGVQQ